MIFQSILSFQVDSKWLLGLFKGWGWIWQVGHLAEAVARSATEWEPPSPAHKPSTLSTCLLHCASPGVAVDRGWMMSTGWVILSPWLLLVSASSMIGDLCEVLIYDKKIFKFHIYSLRSSTCLSSRISYSWSSSISFSRPLGMQLSYSPLSMSLCIHTHDSVYILIWGHLYTKKSMHSTKLCPVGGFPLAAEC